MCLSWAGSKVSLLAVAPRGILQYPAYPVRPCVEVVLYTSWSRYNFNLILFVEKLWSLFHQFCIKTTRTLYTAVGQLHHQPLFYKWWLENYWLTYYVCYARGVRIYHILWSTFSGHWIDRYCAIYRWLVIKILELFACTYIIFVWFISVMWELDIDRV